MNVRQKRQIKNIHISKTIESKLKNIVFIKYIIRNKIKQIHTMIFITFR